MKIVIDYIAGQRQLLQSDRHRMLRAIDDGAANREWLTQRAWRLEKIVNQFKRAERIQAENTEATT